MKSLLLLILFSVPAFAQNYTVYPLQGTPVLLGTLPTALQAYPAYYNAGGMLLSPAETSPHAYNGSYYVGSAVYGSSLGVPVIWLNGLNAPATELLIVNGASIDNGPGGGIYDLQSIDANGNIVGTDGGLKVPPPYLPTYYLLIPTVNPMQAKVTSTEEQLAAALDFIAALKKEASYYYFLAQRCKANKGVC